MVLTVAQTSAFFTNANQMAMPAATVAQLANEGISTVSDLVDFDKDSLQQIASNLRRPGGRIPDPDPNAPRGATIPTPPFVFGAKSQMRLGVACNLVRFYETIGRPLTASNISWNPIMSRFGEIWKSIKEKRQEDEPSTPTINKSLPVMKWTEAFSDHLHRCIGVRMIPLAYVIREQTAVPAACPPLEPNQPFSEANGSIEEDLIQRSLHTHGLFKTDNASVYFKLEEATRSTPQADSIAPFQKKKDGRGAFLALLKQYAGEDKWNAIIKKHDNILHTRKWKGQGNFSLESFIQVHRNAFVSMKAAVQHVAFQLPNEHTRVTYILDAIECEDASLQAAMANIKGDTVVGGKRTDFELAAAHLLPEDPVARKRQSTKRPVADISAMDVDEGPPTRGKPSDKRYGIGKTGVHFRYHTPDEYKKLPQEQKAELALWRIKDPITVEQQKKKRAKSQGANKKNIAAQVKAAFASQKKKEEQEESCRDEEKAYIMSLLSNPDDDKKPAAKASASSVAAGGGTNSKVTLSSILKKAANN